MTKNNQDNKGFRPVFIVGPPRCGTTMLAVLLDRHSRITVPPETQFFSQFIPQLRQLKNKPSREQAVELALSFHRIADLQLNYDDVLKRFQNFKNTDSGLFRSILESYAEKHNKQRPAEKSPRHLMYVPTIFSYYPAAKVICILRDGRDMVRSLEKASWARPTSPRRFGLFCADWNDCVRAALKWSRKYSSERFIIVKYEEILSKPEKYLKKLCDFIGEDFESSQLDADVQTGSVPEWEKEWKNKARKSLDPTRIQAWKKEETDTWKIWQMNSMMGRMLRKAGYDSTDLKKCNIVQRIKLIVIKLPYLKFVRPISLFGLKVIRYFKHTTDKS